MTMPGVVPEMEAPTAAVALPAEAAPGGPATVEAQVMLTDGSTCTLRLLLAHDAAALRAFVRQLSFRSRRLRFLSAFRTLPPDLLARYLAGDRRSGTAVVALADEADGGRVIVGEASYWTFPERRDSRSCEFGVSVADHLRGKGLGRLLLLRLMEVARAEGMTEIRGHVLSHNAPMRALMKSLEFRDRETEDESLVEVVRRL